jgi:hypothetical protein
MSYCSIGPAGAASLSEVLTFAGSGLVSLDLLGNAVASEGLFLLARALLSNGSLRELGLCDNSIGVVSARLLALLLTRLERVGQPLVPVFRPEQRYGDESTGAGSAV